MAAPAAESAAAPMTPMIVQREGGWSLVVIGVNPLERRHLWSPGGGGLG